MRGPCTLLIPDITIATVSVFGLLESRDSKLILCQFAVLYVVCSARGLYVQDVLFNVTLAFQISVHSKHWNMPFSANLIHALFVLIATARGYPGPIPRSHAPVAHVAARAEGADVACSTFAAAWPQAVVTRANTTEYIAETEAHWYVALRSQELGTDSFPRSQTAWKSPDCILTPASVPELQSAYRQIISSNLTFAIRGSGHSPLPLWANVDNGILVSTKSINDIEYNETSQTIRAGFGNNWGALYTYLRPYGRIVLGGRSPTVGLATILGGKRTFP